MAIASSPSPGSVFDEGTPPALVVSGDGARVVVALMGEHDLSTSASVAAALRGAAETGGMDVVLDLSCVQFMDAAIVTVILRGKADLRKRGRALTLRAPSRPARTILKICGLVTLVEPEPVT